MKAWQLRIRDNDETSLVWADTAMQGAKIYDMDEEVVDVKRWTELPGVRVYYDFFKKHEKEFGTV